MRTQVRRQELEDGRVRWRLTEADRQPVSRWLPWEPFVGALDHGRFGSLQDARAFALGVDRVRAEAGLLDGVEAA